MPSIAAPSSRLSVLFLAIVACACSGQASSGESGASPTATMNAYHDALKRKDVEAVKKTLADGYVKMLESAGVASERAFQPMMAPGRSPSISQRTKWLVTITFVSTTLRDEGVRPLRHWPGFRHQADTRYCRISSTRRFRARPSRVSLVSLGRDAPCPRALSRAPPIW
jgi:hypothetical protein